MAMIAPRTIERCPCCFKSIPAKTQIRMFAKDPHGRPIYAHFDCKPATAAEKAVLVGASAAERTALDNLLGAVEFADRATEQTAADAVDGDPIENGVGGNEPPPSDLVKPTGKPAGNSSTPAPAAAGNTPAGKPGLTKADMAQIVGELKKDLSSAAGQFAAEALDKKMTGLVAQAVQAVMPKFEQKVNATTAEQIKAAVQTGIQGADEAIQDAIRELESKADKIVQEQLKKIEEVKEIQHVVIKPNKELVEFPEGEVFHSAFDEVLKLAGAGFNVFLPGPTGCGKTHLGKQVAHALGLRFALISGSAGTTEAEFFGTAYPNITTGEQVYQPTEFIDLFENGGLFLLDEADALDPNCFLKINAALANGYCAVPKRGNKPLAKRHPDFVCIAAANTWGQGATRMYCGRNKLDEATLDRFRAATVEMDYDANVEMKYACPNVKLYKQLVAWRSKINEQKFQRVLSTRFMRDAYILHSALSYTVADIAKKLVGGWTDKEKLAVLGDELAKQIAA